MVRFLLWAGMLAGVLGVAAAGAAAAEAPAGARLAYVVSQPFPHYADEIATVGLDGAGPLRLVGGSYRRKVGPVLNGRPSWSADGTEVAFEGVGAGTPAIFTVRSDGSHLHALPASRRIFIEGSPVMAPDGRSVAVSRIEFTGGHIERPLAETGSASGQHVRTRTAIWSLETEGSGMRRLTPWSRKQVLLPSSYSPDGSTLAATEVAFTGRPASEAVAIDLDSGKTALLARNAKEPTYASDGRIVAVRDRLRGGRSPLVETTIARSDLLVGRPGGPLAKVLGVRHGLAWPSWDPSGQRIAFTKLSGNEQGIGALGLGASVEQVNADGSCLSTLISGGRDVFGGVAWQPGAGREAGRIGC